MSVYDISTLGTVSNLLRFNDYTTLPIFRVVSRAPRQRQIRDLDIPIPFESGISDFQTLEGGSAYIIEGIMYPGSEEDFDNGIAALRKVASLDIQQYDNNANDGYVPYVWTEAARNKQVFVKVLYVDVPESTRQGLVQPFQLVCKVADPTILGTDLLVASTQDSDPSKGDGSAIYPFSYPIVFGASTYSVTATATNSGDLDGFPTAIRVYGPISTPKITNTTTGEYIEIDTNIAANSVLTIRYGKDYLSADVDGTSVLNKASTGTTWFKLKPGGNQIELSGVSISSGAYVEVVYYSGYWPLS